MAPLSACNMAQQMTLISNDFKKDAATPRNMTFNMDARKSPVVAGRAEVLRLKGSSPIGRRQGNSYARRTTGARANQPR
jgi:hypothetical protein